MRLSRLEELGCASESQLCFKDNANRFSSLHHFRTLLRWKPKLNELKWNTLLKDFKSDSILCKLILYESIFMSGIPQTELQMLVKIVMLVMSIPQRQFAEPTALIFKLNLDLRSTSVHSSCVCLAKQHLIYSQLESRSSTHLQTHLLCKPIRTDLVHSCQSDTICMS